MQLLKDKVKNFYSLIIAKHYILLLQIDTLIQSKCYLQTKYINMKKLWQEAEEKLQELK